MVTRWLFLIACAGALPLAGEPKANFTGTWKLEEKAAQAPGPRNIVFRIEHREPNFKYSATGQTAEGEPFTETVAFTTDGKEHPGLYSGTVVGRWKGETVVIEFTINGKPFVVELRLSADGKRMFRDVMGLHETYDRR